MSIVDDKKKFSGIDPIAPGRALYLTLPDAIRGIACRLEGRAPSRPFPDYGHDEAWPSKLTVSIVHPSDGQAGRLSYATDRRSINPSL